METKFCKHCQTNHDLTKDYWFFSNRPTGGQVIQCKLFKRSKNREHGEKNRETNREKAKEHYRNNPDKFKARRERNKERTKTYLKEYREKNKEYIRDITKKWRDENKEYIALKMAQYHLERRAAGYKQPHNNEKERARYKERYHNDIEFRLSANLRNRLRIALQKDYKQTSAVKDLGCSLPELKTHLESMFYPDQFTGREMTWNNYGKFGWHIDHILPLSSFDLSSRENQLLACHYSNLRPMWATENLIKGAKVLSGITQYLLTKNIQEIEKDVYLIEGKLIVRIIKENNCLEFKEKYQNYRVMQFFQDEINEISVSMINNFLKESKQIYARKCEIIEVLSNQARKFLIKNHLMGYTHAKHIGLSIDGELCAVMGYKKHNNGLDITRFCNKNGYNVVGGFSKLLKQLTSLKTEYIQSFCDLRYATGQSYNQLGFKLDSVSYGYYWSNGYKCYNRLSCRANMDERGLTQDQHAAEIGLVKINDCGQAKYIMRTP
jgi:hypothetical protein